MKNVKKMGLIRYSFARTYLIIFPRTLGFALRNVRDIFSLQMALVVWRFIVYSYLEGFRQQIISIL